MEIIEYDDKYAQSIADLWNRSSTGWSGREFHKKAHEIIAELKRSPALHYYLAIENEIVVGLCSLEDYSSDKNGLLIGILSVDPALHGKKIGKALVKQCVEKTSEYQKETLYLFTWDGNEKAVPLYKKCGFYWEKTERHNWTHLINKIPFCLSNPLIKDLLNGFDWYDDFKRTLEIRQDNNLINGFDIYKYEWKKEEKSLTIEWEKNGRGITKIECDEFSCDTFLSEADMILGNNSYKCLNYINKTNIPQKVIVKGLSNDEIVSDFYAEYIIHDKEEIQIPFSIVNKLDNLDYLSPLTTCDTLISINDKDIIFKTGIVIKYPLAINFFNTTEYFQAQSHHLLKLNLINNFKEKASFKFSFPDTDKIIFEKKDFEVTIDSEDSYSLEIPIFLNEATFYHPSTPIIASRIDKSDVVFKRNPFIGFITFTGNYYKKNQYAHQMANGPMLYMLHLNNRYKNGYSFINYSKNFSPYTTTPKIGKPYSNEFSFLDVIIKEFLDENDSVSLIEEYHSKEYTGLILTKKIIMNRSGIFEIQFYINSLSLTKNDIFLSFFQYIANDELIYPNSNNYVLCQTIDEESSLENFNTDNLKSNWLYFKKKDYSMGLTWSECFDVSIDNGALNYEINISEQLRKGQTFLGSIKFFSDCFNSVFSFEKYLKGIENSDKIIIKSRELVINENNPFINDSLSAKFINHKLSNLYGQFTLDSEKQQFQPECVHFNKEDIRTELEFKLSTKLKHGIDKLSLTHDTHVTEQIYSKAFFKLSSEPVLITNEILQDRKVITINNGILEYKICSDFLPGVFSLKYNDNEWLDSSFPKPCIKQRYNPWFGGFNITPSQFRQEAIIEEEISSEKAVYSDQHGNLWKGIKLKTNFVKNNELKNTVINQSYLTLPSIPVLLILCEIENNLNRFMYSTIETKLFNYFGNDFTNGGFAKWEKDKLKKINFGIKSDYYNGGSDLTIYFNKKLNEIMHFLYHLDNGINIQPGLDISYSYFNSNLELKPLERKFYKPMFFIFSDFYLKKSEFEDLTHLVFTEQK